MKKVILMLANGFEEGEMVITHDVILRGGVDVKTLSIHDTLEVTSSQKLFVKADYLLKDFKNWHKVDALVIPGGAQGVNNLIDCSELKTIIQEFHKNNKILAAVCAGPLVLDRAKVLADYNYTCYKTVADIFNATKYHASPGTVVDRNVITSQSAGTSFSFGVEILKKLITDVQISKVIDILTFRDLADVKYY